MSKESSYQRIRSHLSYLGVGTASERLAPALQAAEAEKPAYAAFLDGLLGSEVEATEARRLERPLQLAGFPHQKTLEQFDVSAQPGIDRGLVSELATLHFAEERSNVLLIGPPGVGKTMLAVALARKAVEAGYRGYYTSAADLVTRTGKAAAEGRWQNTMRFWAGPGVLVVDELGYLPLPGEAASHFFQGVSRRYESGSIILTTNRGVAEWGEIFEARRSRSPSSIARGWGISVIKGGEFR